jgi:uncharacterized damage-inducible protein DinB
MDKTISISPQFMLDYVRWANERVLDGARQLPPELLREPIREDFLSTLGLLVHMLAAERAWLSRWQGESPTRLLTIEDLPTLDDLITAWQKLDAEMRTFIAQVQDPAQVIAFRSTKGEPHQEIWWHLFMHVCNHSTEHRSQVALYLAMQGIDVGNLDMTAWLRATR